MRKPAKRDEDAPDAEGGLPTDLNATVALSAEALAALLEEVRGTRNAPLRSDGTPGPDPAVDGDRQPDDGDPE
jgi:hypothetical protein